MEYKVGKLTISNSYKQAIVLFVEPWGRDYWLQPDESFELIALSDKPDWDFYFHADLSQDQVVVYATGHCYDVAIYHNGQEIECGHCRPTDHEF